MKDGTCSTCRWWQPITFQDDHEKHLGGMCVLAGCTGKPMYPGVVNTWDGEHGCYANLYTAAGFGCNQHETREAKS